MSQPVISTAFFAVTPLLTGAFLAVESVTFGKWKSKCGPLDTLRKLTHDDPNNEKKDDEGYNESTNSIHLYSGLALTLLGTVSTVTFAATRRKTFQRIATPTLAMSLSLLSMLFVFDNIVDYFGVSDIDKCLPKWDDGYTNKTVAVLCVYLLAASIMSYSYVFL